MNPLGGEEARLRLGGLSRAFVFKVPDRSKAFDSRWKMATAVLAP
jgi:hypothetical protein